MSKHVLARVILSLAVLLLFGGLYPVHAGDLVVYQYDFEAGYGTYTVDNGVWEVGTPTSGPTACHRGSQCADTVLGGNYPIATDSRLYDFIGIQLPIVGAGEGVLLRYWQWFAFADTSDSGKVQISELDTGGWTNWTDILNAGPFFNSSGGWSPFFMDLTAYAGKTSAIRFLSHVLQQQRH